MRASFSLVCPEILSNWIKIQYHGNQLNKGDLMVTGICERDKKNHKQTNRTHLDPFK